MRFILKLIFDLWGWKIEGTIPTVKKYVMAVAPHTSGWDFVVGILARSVLKIEKVKFLGKSQLFRPPFGWFFRALGGTPVDRNSPHDVVDQVVEKFKSHQEFFIALAPEGTRRKVEKLRTGFYFIAKGAGVPILPVGFDFARKVIIIGQLFFPTENFDEDIDFLLDFFRKIQGKNPSLGLS